MIQGAPEVSREGLGPCDMVDFENQVRVPDAAIQNSTLEKEQKLDQKRAEIYFRRGRQRTKMYFYQQICAYRKTSKTGVVVETM